MMRHVAVQNYADHVLHVQFVQDVVFGACVEKVYVWACRRCDVLMFAPLGGCTVPCHAHAKLEQHPGPWTPSTRFTP